MAPGIGELATPTGVALVRGLASTAGPQPAMTVCAIGVGAGTKDTPGRPNVVRVVIGEPVAHTDPTSAAIGAGSAVSDGPDGPAHPDAHDTPASAVQIEANVDDLDPRLWPGTVEALLEQGALDAWLTPIVMKRGRPAITVHALARESDVDAVSATMMQATGTLGVRMHAVTRRIRSRSFEQVQVQGQPIAVKVARDESGAVVRREPEFRDVAAAARELGISEREMLRLARSAAAHRPAGD